MISPHKYLITGASGFIGPYLVRELLAKGHFCRCLVRSPEKVVLPDAKNLEIVKADITQPASLAGVAESIDTVFHLATLGHMSNYSVPEEMFEAVNVKGTEHVIREALSAGVKKVVHCSSVAAMGICGQGPANEETPCHPHHPYGESKLKAEALVQSMVAESGLPASIVRFSMVYGPGDWRDMLRLARMAKKGFFPKIGKRAKLTPLIHVQDAVQGLLLVAEKGKNGDIYLLTNPQSEPFDKVISLLKKAQNVKRPSIYVPEALALLLASAIEQLYGLIGKTPPVTKKNIESTLADRVFSSAKAQRELGFAPEIDPVEGLTETVQWYLENNWL